MMKSFITTLLAVLPTLAYGLTTPGIGNVPAAPIPFSNEDPGAAADAEEDILMDVNEVALKDTYPRPTLDWLTDLPRPKLGSVPYGRVLTQCTEPNTIALTFDDGPWKYTSDLLDLLEDNGARATFFVCGGNMGGDGQLTRRGYPPLLRRMVAGGHQVGTHTWAHADLSAMDADEVAREVLDNEQALVQDLGFIPTYFRPPYFSANEEVLDVVGDLGYHVVNAGVDTRDWTGDYDAARENFDEAVRGGQWGDNGRIVLAHDIKEKTAHELAEYMIEQADEHGYRLVTVGECLGDAARNWYRSPSTGKSWLARSRAPIRKRGHGGGGGGGGDGRDKVVEEWTDVMDPTPHDPTDEYWDDGDRFTGRTMDFIPGVTHRHLISIDDPTPTPTHYTALAKRSAVPFPREEGEVQVDDDDDDDDEEKKKWDYLSSFFAFLDWTLPTESATPVATATANATTTTADHDDKTTDTRPSLVPDPLSTDSQGLPIYNCTATGSYYCPMETGPVKDLWARAAADTTTPAAPPPGWHIHTPTSPLVSETGTHPAPRTRTGKDTAAPAMITAAAEDGGGEVVGPTLESLHTVIIGNLCKRPGESCVPVYKTVTRVAVGQAEPITITTTVTRSVKGSHHGGKRYRRNKKEN